MIIVTRKEIIETRKKLLKQMHEYIIALGDERLYEKWIICGVPDCPQEDDFDWIASEDDEWNDVCRLFGRIIKM